MTEPDYSPLYEVDIDPNDTDALTDLAQIRPDKLEREMTCHPATFAFWNAQLANAHEHLLKAKHNRDRVEAKLYLQIRYELESSGHKVTEKAINSRVLAEDELNDAELEVIRAEASKKRIENVVRTIQIKGDMLTNIGMRINAEIKSNPLAAAQARGDRLSGS